VLQALDCRDDSQLSVLGSIIVATGITGYFRFSMINLEASLMSGAFGGGSSAIYLKFEIVWKMAVIIR
jgi:hypothetical protein